MKYIEKVQAAQVASAGFSISGGELRKKYLYGENPFADMLIENALFCDMFPEEVADPNDSYGFNRSLYTVSRDETP